MANYFAGVFGMLGVAYFVSHKLDRLASWLLVAMYTFFCLGMLSELYELGNSLHRFAVSIQSRNLQDSSIAWHAAVRGMTFKHIPQMTVIMATAIYVATMVFYFRARRHKGPGFEL